jgi:hypothetical protein
MFGKWCVMIVALFMSAAACESDVERKMFAFEAGLAQAAATELAAVSKETGLTFPAGSRLLGVTRERGMEYVLQAKVEIPETRVDEFFAAAPIKRRALTRRRGLFGPGDSFYDPSQEVGVLSGQAQVGGHAINIGVLNARDGMIPVLLLFATM